MTAAVRRRTVTVRDRRGVVDLAVHEQGDPDRPVWLVAHGAGSSARFVLAAFGPALAEVGRRLVALDLRGHGASSPAPRVDAHHLDVHAADLAAVIATLPDLEVVGGISLGAHAVVRAAPSADLGGTAALLACLPAWTGPATAGLGPHAAVAAEVRRVGVVGVVARLRTEPGLPGWLRDTLVADYARHDPASLTAALLALDGGDAPTLAEVAALPRPLAVVGWTDDPGHPLEVGAAWAAAAASGPGGRLGTLHLDDLDGPDGVARLGREAVRTVLALRA